MNLSIRISNRMTKLNYSFVVMLFISIPFYTLAQSVELKHAPVHAATSDLHVVTKGETLYSISKSYQTTIDELRRLNPDILDNNLPLGSTIKVPVVKEAMTPAKKGRTLAPVYYTVRKKETLYAISKKFNTKVDSLISWNNLTNAEIAENGQLIVGFESDSYVMEGPLKVTGQAKAGAIKVDSVNKERIEPAVNSNSSTGTFPEELAKRGIATWVKSEDDGGDFFALHATAPKGTMIQVKNEMNGKVVEVKVIGKLPATSVNENLLIKISASAAKQLGVLDDRFLAAIYYEAMYDDAQEEKSSSVK